jgi:arsenate reductase
MNVIIYHNPDCGTSRNTLGLIRNAGIEPTVIEYLNNPPDCATLVLQRDAFTKEDGEPVVDAQGKRIK